MHLCNPDLYIMPKLKKIVIQDFRNIELQELAFSPNINCISGNNGEGKTNLLDAVWYLSMTKSAFSVSDRFNFRHGTSGFSLSGTYLLENGTTSRVSLSASKDAEKKLRRDDKPLTRFSEHIGQFPIVMVSPADTTLVSEGGDDRRRFVNSVLSQTSAEYLSAVQQYQKVLALRNKVLRDFGADPAMLDMYDEKLSEIGGNVREFRAAFAMELSPAVQEKYAQLSGDAENVDIEYRTDLEKGPLLELLRASREKDAQLGYTSVGLQRDDFVFRIGGYPIRRCGSQGQQKSFLVALKFAQYEMMKKEWGFAPILLLDDLFDKLDMNRVGNLLKMVAGNDFGQIFITDSNKVRMSALVDSITSDRAYFEAAGGVFRSL